MHPRSSSGGVAQSTIASINNRKVASSTPRLDAISPSIVMKTKQLPKIPSSFCGILRNRNNTRPAKILFNRHETWCIIRKPTYPNIVQIKGAHDTVTCYKEAQAKHLPRFNIELRHWLEVKLLVRCAG